MDHRQAALARSLEVRTGGRILKDANGRPTGILVDAAMELVRQVALARAGLAQQQHVLLGHGGRIEGLLQRLPGGVAEHGLGGGGCHA